MASVHATPAAPSWSVLSIPPPLKRLFDAFPVVTYPANALPQNSPASDAAGRPALYVFSTDKDAARGRPSFNPGCLKWQTYLKFAGIDHDLVASNNHASPSGALPFLLLPGSSGSPTDRPTIPSHKLEKYAAELGRELQVPADTRYVVYQSLVDHQLRQAWLYHLYLDASNFERVAKRLYVTPVSSNPLVQEAVAHQLRSAAETELRKTSPVVNKERIFWDAIIALDALALALGEDDWFFGAAQPSLLDAAVFAYTHLLLDDTMGWQQPPPPEVVRAGDFFQERIRERPALVRHRDRILHEFFRR